MAGSVDQKPGIIDQFRSEEARLRRRMVLLTILPVVAGLIVITGSFWVLKTSYQRVTEATEEVARLTVERNNLTESLEAARQEAKRTQDDLTRSRLAAERVRRGINHYQRGEFGAAIREYSAAIEIDPNNFVVHDWLGYAYHRNRQYPEAVSSLRRSVEISPNYARGYYNLALPLWALGNREDAVKAISRAIELDPSLRATVRQDGQFAPFRQSAAFQKLLSPSSPP